jgi:polar amino acid transport system substrate-binding protein
MAALALVATGLAGCGKRAVIYAGDTGDSSSTTVPTLDLGLPFRYQKAKVINVGSDISYPPMESLPQGATAPQGFDVDLANALGGKLGVQFVFQNTKFESLVTGLTANKYDIVMSAMKDTQKRRDQGVDFVDYFQDGLVVLVPKGNPKKFKNPADLCGRTVAVPGNTIAEEYVRGQSSTCPAAPGGSTTTTAKGGASGSSTTATTRKVTTTVKGTTKTTVATGRITVMTVADSAAAAAAVKAGRAQAAMDELPLAANQVLAAPTALELLGDQVQAVPYGIAVPNTQTQLRDAIVNALKAIVADGSYAAMLQKWNMPQGAIGDVSLNTGS